MKEGVKIRCCGSPTCGRIEGVERWCVWSECAAWRETKAGVAARTDENNNPIAGVAAEGFCGLAGPEVRAK